MFTCLAVNQLIWYVLCFSNANYSISAFLLLWQLNLLTYVSNHQILSLPRISGVFVWGFLWVFFACVCMFCGVFLNF